MMGTRVMRFALISHILPPSPSGQAVGLYRILSGFGPEEYYLVNSRSIPPEASGNSRLPAPCYRLPPEPTLSGPSHFGLWRIRNLINLTMHIWARTMHIIAVLRREPATTAVVACSGDLEDIPAGFLASKIMGLPFYAYIFDDYVFQWVGGYRLFAKLIAPFILRSSAGVIAPNEFLREEYQRRYGVRCTLIRNPNDPVELQGGGDWPWPAEEGRITMVYTGAVYHANYDSLQNLVDILDGLECPGLELDIFTSQTEEDLASQGIQGTRVHIKSHVPYDQVLECQRKADILFLPLAFDTPIKEVIRTSAPGKLAEYLASGRPILAHVPANSFVAHYLEKNQCGVVASENDPIKLKSHILRLFGDESLRRHITHNARQKAHLDFDPRISQERLASLLAAEHTGS